MITLPDFVASLRRLAATRAATPLACIGLSVALVTTGCHKDKPPETKTETQPAAPVANEARKNSQRTQPDEGVEVPTEEDFEEQSEKQITADSNLQKELDTIEKQITGGG
jgi:hypothetical protein